MSGVVARTAAVRPKQWLVRQLPSGMLGEDFFVRFVSLFQAEADSLLEHADALEHLADLDLTPTEMVRYLAQWIGAPGVDSARDDQQMRALVRAAASTVRIRGTVAGLTAMVEAFTGLSAQVEESGGVYRLRRAALGPGWVSIRVPSSGNLSQSALVDLVRDEVPAHVRVELWVADQRVWATAGWDGPQRVEQERA